MVCQDCGDPDASTTLDDVVVCDRCCDVRIAEFTGLPRLPDPPPPFQVRGPDGRNHRLRFRIWRAPTGVEVQLDEVGVPVGEGYRFAVLGDHDADVEDLVARVQSMARSEVGRLYLEPVPHREGWALRGDEVVGQLVWNDQAGDGKPYSVIIDGRTLSWEELGSATRRRYERVGLLVEEAALDQAEQDCLADEEARSRRRQREEERRGDQDLEFQAELAAEIRRLFPGCPPGRAEAIAQQAGARRSGRIGRSAAGRALDPVAITLAVVASVRHLDAPYDALLMSGLARADARARVADQIETVLHSWRAVNVP